VSKAVRRDDGDVNGRWSGCIDIDTKGDVDKWKEIFRYIDDYIHLTFLWGLLLFVIVICAFVIMAIIVTTTFVYFILFYLILRIHFEHFLFGQFCQPSIAVSSTAIDLQQQES
jgi:hypothetical protein